MTPNFKLMLQSAELPILEAQLSDYTNPNDATVREMLRPGCLYGSIVYEMDIMCHTLFGQRLGTLDYAKDAKCSDGIKPVLYNSGKQLFNALSPKLLSGMLNEALNKILTIDIYEHNLPTKVSINPNWNPLGVKLEDLENGEPIPLPSEADILASGVSSVLADFRADVPPPSPQAPTP